MNKNIALIIAAAITMGQIPVSALAEENPLTVVIENAPTENAATLQKKETNYKYNQEYADYSSTSWTTLGGGGNIIKNMDNPVPETEGKNGYLQIKRDAAKGNKFIFLEDQSPEVKDFEAEVRFKISPEEGKKAGRFGIIFRGKDANSYGFIGYNGGETAAGKWLIETSTAWKDDISGPTIEGNQWVTMNVKVQRSNVILTVNGKEIFNGAVSLGNFPTEAGKFGYRTWFDNKDIAVDYLKIKSLDEDAVTGIAKIQDISLETLLKVNPELPYKVNVTYSDGTAGQEVVIWDYVDPSKYNTAGNFIVEGKIKGAAEGTPKVKANINVRGKINYSTDFETSKTSGNWKVLKPIDKEAIVENGVVNIPMNGVSISADMASPNIKNFSYETDFTVNSDTGRIGLGFRIKDADNWGAICYDAGSWVWKSSNNGSESYGSFPGSFKLEANKKYRMKLEVEGNKMTLLIDGNVIGTTISDKLPNTAGKIGLVGWFANKTITLDNVKVEEIAKENEGKLPEVQVKSIESDKMVVTLDNTFPRVIQYKWKDDGSILVGQEDRFNKVSINGKNYSPVVTCSLEENKANYTMVIDEIGVTLTVVISVENNKIRMEVTNIKEAGDFLVKKVAFPNNSFATVRSDNGGAIAAVLSTGQWHQITDEINTVENLEPSNKNKTYAFINDNNFAITMNNNVIEYSNRILLNTKNKNGYKSTGIGTGTWTYREVENSDIKFYGDKENLWTEVFITKDMNDDKNIDWQDAAIQYRNNVKAPMGGEMIKDSLSYIAFNIGYTQSPFLRTLDTVKKLYNYTDGFGQMVLEKGYQGEGHDDVIPDYCGHFGIRQGGIKDFNTLIKEGSKYNAKFGVHINATEYQLDAFQYPDGIVNENAKGWNWLDQAYYVNQRADLTTGALFKRLDQLKKDAPDLGWVYVDVYTGNGWNAHQLGEKLNNLGYPVATEFHSPLEEHVIWNHWGADPAYPNKGGTSEILRFIRNSTKDGFLANPLLKGSKHLLSNGWGNNHAIEGEKGLYTFYNQVLPTKYMQHFDIMKMTDDEVIFNENLKAIREGADINYYKDGRLVATTPENTIGETGIGKTKLFLEWNFKNGEDKIYHWNPFGTTSEWELPKSWGNLSNVYVYELTDLGRVKVGTVDVINGKVNLNVKQNTPYIVTKGEIPEDRIDSWGEGVLIKDNGFDSQEWKTWSKESEEGNTDHIKFINETAVRRAGNDVVSISNGQGKISQNIQGLKSGKTYSVSAWVKNDGNRKITLGIKCGDKTETNIITRSAEKRAGEGHKYLDDNFTRMEVEFTVPEGITNANIYIDAAKGNGDVIVDDFRIWEHPGHTNKDGYIFYEDFENVDEGITPFFLGPNRGTSNRSHLAEKDLYGRQKMNWVLDGRFSLKTNQQSNEKGEMLITEESTFKLEPNTTYELGFLYSLKDDTPKYTVNVKSKSNGGLVSIPLNSTNIEEGKYTNPKSITNKFTTGDKDDYYISIDKKSGYADLILDNIYVSKIDDTIKKPELNKVNLGLSVNTLDRENPFDISLISLNGLMNNGSKADLKDAKVKYIVSDKDIAKVEGEKIIGLKDGITTLVASVDLNGKTIKSNSVTLKVGAGEEEVPPVNKVDKDKLQVVVNLNSNLVEKDYTKETWKPYKEALDAANAILAKKDAKQNEVDEAKSNLESAIKELKKLASDTTNNSTNENNKGENNTNNPNNNRGNTNININPNNNSGNTNINTNKEKDKTNKEKNTKKPNTTNAIDTISKVNSNVSEGKGTGVLPYTGGTSGAALGFFGTIMATIGALIFKKRK
ncbi:endo-alpha-N-acetylgalactosaminidase family protein [Clostridium carnis]